MGIQEGAVPTRGIRATQRAASDAFRLPLHRWAERGPSGRDRPLTTQYMSVRVFRKGCYWRTTGHLLRRLRRRIA